MDSDIQTFHDKIVLVKNSLRSNQELITVMNDIENIFNNFIKRLNDLEMQKTGIENEEKDIKKVPAIVYRVIRYNDNTTI